MKGFTLIELLTVIVILAIISVITVPIVNNLLNSNKEKLYGIQLEEIKDAAADWALENRNIVSELNELESLSISLGTLKELGYIQVDVVNPKTDEPFDPNTEIVITKTNNNFSYEVVLISEDNSSLINISLNGESNIFIARNEVYTEQGATATDGTNDLDIHIQYFYKGNEVRSIDTANIGTYEVIYSASLTKDSKIYTNKIYRVVFVQQ